MLYSTYGVPQAPCVYVPPFCPFGHCAAIGGRVNRANCEGVPFFADVESI